MKNKNKVGGITLPNIEARVIKTVWDGQRDKHIVQWNRTRNPDTDPYKSAQLSFDKVVISDKK